MIETATNLWSLLTIFFSVEVLQDMVFLTMIMFVVMFTVINILLWFFDPKRWGVKF